MIKRKILASLLVCHIYCLVSAQNDVKWDSTYRPGNYASRLETFRGYPDSKKDIIFLGNSITHYAEWSELFPGKQVRNRGISGDITFGVLERLDEITAGRPAKVFILIGINDISRNIPAETIVNNYRRIIQIIKKESPRTRIFFNTLLPVNNTFAGRPHFNKDDQIAWVNQKLKELGTEEKITVIDIHPAFKDAEGRLDKKYTYDGLHINIEGYKVWKQLLKPYL